MRILHIGKYFPPALGGMERYLGDLVKAQREAGHEVEVLVHADRRSRHGGDPPWVHRCPVWLRLIFAPVSPTFPLWIRRLVRRFRPDVIHIHMPNPSAFWAMLLPSARAVPWVVHWHSDIEVSRPALRLTYPHYRIFERGLLERAEAIIATSPQYLTASRTLRPWRPKCRVVPLGVDPGRLPDIDPSTASSLWTTTDGLRLLAVGRLTYYKGFETLVRAALDEPGMELAIVGEGEERARLEGILDKAGHPSRIRLLGEADDEVVHRLLASCDVYCLPSCERTEAFGIVLMEAMRYGKPLLASDLPGSGVGWLARPGENAMTVPSGDVAAWREALRELAAAPDLRASLGRRGQERYARELDIHRQVPRVNQVYRAALNARSGDQVAAEGFEPAYMEGEEEGDVPVPVGAERVLIVIPALNEAEDIGEVIRQVRAQGAIDVLVVDDGSTDGTAQVALDHGASVIRAPLWQGAWGAIQTGIRFAVRHGYSGVVTMDADGQHEPAYLERMLQAADRGADVVIAACPSRGSALRRLAWSYFRLLTGFEFDDLTSGFRYYNARACRLLAGEEATLLDYQDIGVLLLLRHAQLRIAEIAVAMSPRRHGASRVFSSWWTVGVYMAETSLLCLARWNQAPRGPKATLPKP